MPTKVEKSIEVNVPVSTAYNQWTQFEQFPRFMGGVQQVRQLDDRRLHWVAEIGGVKREWDARILEQVPDEKVSWAATSGATNAGAVYFQSVSADRTLVRLVLEYEPEGLVEQVGDKLNIVAKRAEADLEKFKAYIESRGVETGAWRGSVDEGRGGTPGVEDAAASRGDSGTAGVSGKAVAAGAAVAAAGVAGAAAAAAARKSGDDEDTEPKPTETGYVTSGVDTAGYPAGTETPGYPGGTGTTGDATRTVTDPDERGGTL
jgi:carbon monoxide dehydrogenase subunit G